MGSYNTSEFRKGLKVQLDGDPYIMTECNFVKPGKGQALYKCKLRNLIRGTMLDRTYKSGDGLEGADVHRADAQYLYRDSQGYVFMDNESFEQHTVAGEILGDGADFLLDNMVCELLYWNGQVIGVTPPAQVIMEVTYTEPAARGNTATNVTKPATVTSGATIQVPSFINVGDKVKIDTAEARYIERIRD